MNALPISRAAYFEQIAAFAERMHASNLFPGGCLTVVIGLHGDLRSINTRITYERRDDELGCPSANGPSALRAAVEELGGELLEHSELVLSVATHNSTAAVATIQLVSAGEFLT